MKKDLITKMLKEAKLTREEEARLDALLESKAQQTVSHAVESVPGEELNLAWRGNLNSRLVVESAKRKRRQRIFLALKPAVGLSLAGAMAVMVWVQQPSTVPAGPYKAPIEMSLITAHQEAATVAELNGSTIATYHNPTSVQPREDWTEVDLGTL
ncbi:MAG: hypothetical protein KF784_07910 [Fimbriimonadaceae bacterium]|nr:hypothetical protein [Fimbriimonadaceae bacterium]